MNASRSQRMLSLWLPRLSTDRIARSREQIAPLVVYGKRGNADVLTAVDERAAQLGLAPGLALAQARAMHPALEVVPEDADADAQLLETIADACLRYTPLVACDAPDGVLLDITGCAHLYGGEEALVADLGQRLEAAGFAFSLAIAGSIGAAWAAAHCGEPGSYACGDERKLLAPLPLAALRLPSGTVASLARVGLKRIGDIIDLPRSPLTARFGADVLRQLDRALGQEHEPLNPRLPVAPYVAEQRFAEPIAREEDVLKTVERLAGRLKIALERRGDGARRLELTLFRTDGALRRIAAGTSRPSRAAARHPRAVRGAACRTGRCARSRLRLRHGAAVGAGGRALRARADRHRRRAGRGRARPPGRSPERAAGRAARAPADRAGQPYSRARRGCRFRRR